MALPRHFNHSFSFQPRTGYFRSLRQLILSTILMAALATLVMAQGEEFFGPMPSWINVRGALYNAAGNGIADDTAALQRALNDSAKPGKSVYVYLPAGTYRITDTLVVTGLRGLRLVGEDPATTTIVWGGSANKKMMLKMFGCADGVITRLTFDGQGGNIAGIYDDWGPGSGGLYAGNWRFADLVIRNVTEGINAGFSDYACAESLVLRCKFINNSICGFKICNFNALNWWLWYCSFEDCGTAVHESKGGLHVTRCVFKRSKVQDIYLENSANAGIRENYSIGSKKFYRAGSGQSDMFHGNVILDTDDSEAITANGVDFFLDNIIRSAAVNRGPAVNLTGNDLTAVGNTFTVAHPFVHLGRSVNVDQRIMNRAQVDPREPLLPGAPPKTKRVIFEVTSPGTGADIQQAIDQAAASKDSRPVVYIHAGSYPVSKTIVVPAERPMQIVGEGMYGITTLIAPAPSGLPVLRLAGPSRVLLSSFLAQSHPSETQADTVVIENADQTGGRIFMEHVHCSDFLNPATNSNLLVDQLDQTIVESRCINFPSVRVVGGPLAAAGEPSAGRTRLIGCNSGWFSVSRGGNLHVADLYSEVNTEPCLVLSGSGTFTMEAAMYKRTMKPTGPGIILEDFAGTAAFMGAVLVDIPIEVRGTGAKTKALINARFTSWTSYIGEWYTNKAPQARSAVVNALLESTIIPDSGPKDDQFLRDMVANSRNNLPFADPLPAVPAGATDVRLYGVQIGYGRAGIRISR